MKVSANVILIGKAKGLPDSAPKYKTCKNCLSLPTRQDKSGELKIEKDFS